ncbi:MAG: sulfite exporter TauE/SafE family protein [Rhodospirillales bacterium]|nr:sulfite exporter TauE/SafE family protein [Rhodospirillales bacterium]
MDAASIIAIVTASFAAAFASGLAGFAFALIASGVLLHVMPPLEAVPLILAGSLAVQAITLINLRGGVRWGRLWPFLAGGIVGMPFGVAILRVADADLFRLIVGAFLVAYSLYMLFRPAPALVTVGGRAADGAVGVVGGVMGGLAGLSGVVSTIWCGLRGWPMDEQRGVYQPYIFVVHLAALAWFGGRVGFTAMTAWQLLLSAPALIVGTWLGLKLYRRIDDRQFRRIVLGLLLVSGAILLF